MTSGMLAGLPMLRFSQSPDPVAVAVVAAMSSMMLRIPDMADIFAPTAESVTGTYILLSRFPFSDFPAPPKAAHVT
jgi:hypothetical protein